MPKELKSCWKRQMSGLSGQRLPMHQKKWARKLLHLNMSSVNPIWNSWKGYIALLLLIFLLVGMTWANYQFAGAPRYVQRDFMSLWGGGRALLEGINPYDPDLWNPLRERYGSTWFPDTRNPFPLWTLLIMLPFSALEFGWGAATWLTTNQILLCAIIFMLTVSLGINKPTLALFSIVAIGVVTFRGSLVSLHNGQFTIVILLALILAMLFSKHNYPIVAGLCLSWVIMKPNAFILLAPLLVIWLFWRGKWKFIYGLFLGIIFWIVTSWIVSPGWFLEWLNVSGKAEVVYITPTVWGIAATISPDVAPMLGLGLAIGVTALVGWIIFSFPVLDFSYVLALGMAGSLLVMPYGWSYEHVYLIIPLGILMVRIRRPWVATIFWFIMIGAIPWLLYWWSNRVDSAIPETAMPALALVALIVFLLRNEASAKPIVDYEAGDLKV